jgi:hypothetical protein
MVHEPAHDASQSPLPWQSICARGPTLELQLPAPVQLTWQSSPQSNWQARVVRKA